MEPEDIFEAMLAQLAAHRPAEALMHATARAEGRPPEVPAPFHHHDVHGCYEFAWVSEGETRIATPDDLFHLAPGRLLLIDPGVEHDESPGDPPGPYLMFWCHLQATLARLYRTGYSPPTAWRRGPTIEVGGRTSLDSIAVAIATEMDTRDWGWTRSVHSLLVYLTCILTRRLRRGNALHLRGAESPTISADPRTWRVIHGALQFCEANFRRPLRLNDVAAAVGYSPSHLSRLISTHLGHSLSDHIRSLRIAAAKHLLESSNLSIAHISRSLGYADPSHFSHAFKRAAGVSPRSYRQRMGAP